jgi:putative ABC transport system permease protein
MRGIWQDIRFGARQLMRAPGFTAAAVLSLAIGIGANTAVFSVVNSVLFGALPYADPDRLVEIWETFPSSSGTGRGSVSVPNFDDWRAQSDVFEDMAAYSHRPFNLSAGGDPIRLSGAGVTEAAFRLLGVAALHGRPLIPSDFEPGNSHVVVLSHRLWQEQFAGDPHVVGRTVKVNGVGHEVVGVMPSGFSFPPRSDLEIWAPLIPSDEERESRGWHWMLAIGRLRPGVSQAEAQSAMDVVAQRLAEQYPNNQENRGVLLRSFHDAVVGSSKPALLAMWSAVGLILLIACGNVANLQLARFSAKARDLAVRSALGAGRARLIRQALAESLLLSLAGGVAGFAVCFWTIPILRELPGANLPPLAAESVDGRVLLFCLAAAAATAILGGLAPALRAAGADPQDNLRASTGVNRDPARDILRRSLVIAEVALAVVVVVGAGLLVRSFERITAIDPGLNPENVLTLHIPLMGQRYAEPRQAHDFFTRLLERVEATPGIVKAGVTQVLPIQNWGWNGDFRIRGRAVSGRRDEPSAEIRRVSPDYLAALGVPLLAGRALSPLDLSADTERGALINEALAKRYWPDGNPIGEQIGYCGPDQHDCWYTIVGIVGTMRNSGFRTDPQPEIYLPFTHGANREMVLVVRSAVEPTQLTRKVREEVLALDPEQPIYRVATMEQVIAERVSPERFHGLVFSAFGLLATALAMAGIYGLVSYSTTRRTREIGLRMALGAERANVRLLVLRQGLTLGLYGIGAGLLLALALGRSLQTLLFEVEPADPLVLASVAVGIAAVTAFASWWPASRASRLQPTEALRHD